MIISPALLTRRLFSQQQFLTLYKEVRDYLPRAQYKDFLRSWIINNLLVGPKKRKRFELKNKCTLPAVINLSPTERCNLNCTGCYAASYSRNHEMTLSEIETIIQQAKELGIYFIGFLGGEPFLRKDLFSIIQKHKDVAFRISTNGTMLDQEILDGLRNCGNLVVFLSLEGFEAHTDMWRGPGAYAKILKTMATLKRERILFGFSLLLHSENLAPAISEQFLDSMRDAGCKFGLYFPYGPIGDNARYDLALSEEQIQSTFKKLTALEDRYSMLLLKEGYSAPTASKNYILEQGCRSGVTVHITPEGYVEPCNGIQFYTVNVFKQGLEQVFQSPFYKDIYDCVQRKGKHCVGMFSPQEVLEIVNRNNANGSHPLARGAYSEYAQFHLGRISAARQSGQKAPGG